MWMSSNIKKILNLTTSHQDHPTIFSQAPITSCLDYCKNILSALPVSALFLLLPLTSPLDHNRFSTLQNNSFKT